MFAFTAILRPPWGGASPAPEQARRGAPIRQVDRDNSREPVAAAFPGADGIALPSGPWSWLETTNAGHHMSAAISLRRLIGSILLP